MSRDKTFPAETMYPDLQDIFSDHLRDPSEIITDCLVFLDANVLLLPYRMDNASYKELMIAYQKLSTNGRLKIPAQAAREFVKNRGKIIAEIVKNLRDKKGRIPRVSDTTIMRHFDLDGKFKQAGDEMASLIDDVIKRFSVLGGQDPITKDYRSHLLRNVVDPSLTTDEKKDFEEDLKFRQAHDIAPGFKDSGKSDGGSGDLLIWKMIIKFSRASSKDAIFVTGKAKNDWFDRIDKQPFSLRYELIEEFRRETGGKSVHVVSASRFLHLMEASEKVVSLTAALESQSFISTATLTVRRAGEERLRQELQTNMHRLDTIRHYIRSAEAYASGENRGASNAAGGEAIAYLENFRQEEDMLERRNAIIGSYLISEGKDA